MAYPKQVLEIHNEFQTASEKLLSSAMEVINQCGPNMADKVARLEKAGFKNSVDVKRFESVKVTHEQANLIQHYQQRYPDNKFITEAQVKNICKKYNLECAPVERYKGFVPESKLKQIENFYMNQEDERPNGVRILEAWNVAGEKPLYGHDKSAKLIHKILGTDVIPADHPQFYWQGTGRLYGVMALSKLKTSNLAYVEKYELIKAERSICAPKKDFDLTGLTKIGALFMSITTVHVPDPVVLQPVKGGFLILAAWGDEASDELVMNPKHN